MDAFKLFRVLIIAKLAGMIASVLASFFGPAPPHEVTDWFDRSGGGLLAPVFESENWSAILALLGFCLAYVVAWVATLIGMMRFRPWSRMWFIAMSVLGFLWLPVIGQTWTTPLEGLFNGLILMCQGAVLALLFVEPVAGRFRRESQPAT